MTRTYFFSAKKYAKTGTKWSSAKLNSSLKPRSALRSKTFDTKEVHPSTIVKNFAGDKCREFTEHASLCYRPRPFYRDSASSSLQSKLMSPVNILTSAPGGTTVRSEYSSDEFWTLLRSKVSRPSGMEDKKKFENDNILFTDIRQSIIAIASKELGTSEATGNNDGNRVEQYLRYTNLGKGHEWCAAFVSWCAPVKGL